MSALYTFIDNLMAETIKKEYKTFVRNAHIYDEIIMRNWKEMRRLAMNQNLFKKDDIQQVLYDKLVLESNEIQTTHIYSMFVESKQGGAKDAFIDEYVNLGEEGTPKPPYYQPVNALEFWLVMFAYLKYLNMGDCIQGIIKEIGPPSYGGYVANLFSEVVFKAYLKELQRVATDYHDIDTLTEITGAAPGPHFNGNKPQVNVKVTPEDIQKNKSLEIVKGALSLAGIICGSLLLAGVITFPIASFALMLIGGCLISIGGLYSAYKLSETFAPQR